ncbi:hypothetical protein F5Y19DRAFT_475570 [Xylariaceae sp. FL1651]|nr:hypothetical protein F5Y19DRAFT_475570 [Xylariaceae sp. FL1651]
MKVLIVGASGSIGSEALVQCLAHPSISIVIAFVRRDLPAEVSKHPKLKCVLIKDFSVWPEDVLEAHADAAAMIWAMGSYRGSRAADLEYPYIFIESMGRVLETKPSRPPFRYVHLSGKFVRQDQDKKLWYFETPRKLKGLLETRALAFAESHAAIWRTFIVKPGGVITKNMIAPGVIAALFGANWCIRNEELGAFMAYLAISGEGEEPITENARSVTKGREVLEMLQNGSES